MAEGDVAEPGRDNGARRFGAVRAKIKARLRHYIGMAPAVQHDGGDVASCIEAVIPKQPGEVGTDLQLEVAIARRKELAAAEHNLLLQGSSGVMRVRYVQCQDDRLRWVQRLT